MRKLDFIVKIAADSIEQLRRIDVDRVLYDCTDEERKPFARYILAHHPNYAGAINASLKDILPFEVHSQSEDCIVSEDGRCIVCFQSLPARELPSTDESGPNHPDQV